MLFVPLFNPMHRTLSTCIVQMDWPGGNPLALFTFCSTVELRRTRASRLTGYKSYSHTQ